MNGTYTYVSEDNTITVIDVPGDVINNFEEIIKNQTVLNELTQIINEVGGISHTMGVALHGSMRMGMYKT